MDLYQDCECNTYLSLVFYFTTYPKHAVGNAEKGFVVQLYDRNVTLLGNKLHVYLGESITGKILVLRKTKTNIEKSCSKRCRCYKILFKSPKVETYVNYIQEKSRVCANRTI